MRGGRDAAGRTRLEGARSGLWRGLGPGDRRGTCAGRGGAAAPDARPVAAGDGEAGEAGAGTTGLSITPPLQPTEVQFYLKLLSRRDALAKAGDGASEAARVDAAETDAALERALDGLARRRLRGMA